ncbi:dihydrofolate reductase family protein [Nocardia sp. CDC159]|uniref:Dihydrofolate reductase family protein n=1 Tax=Nocardia pulmonis TaxID=2951408 RepID=A0A9X2IX98_9NOCA|nr:MULTISPECIES: dihydrofolate reductase family protein [Nocardia]MCM6772676.1 dihydrofolate reductase family protein [Nocardia pulmonis]MCM6786021.1 dihydrofolate reductase family protein [Nocardia sp. CDC159]
MRKLVYYVAVSLDGYIAGPGGEFDFYPVSADMAAWFNERYPETVPTHIRPHVGLDVNMPNREWGTLIMGRGTYDPALEIGVASPYAHMKQYVVSRTLGPVDDPMVEVVDEDPVELVRRLKKEADTDIWLCGGGILAGQLIDEVDELIIKSYPVIAGAGVPMFTGKFSPARFTPTKRQDFDSGAQVSWFTRA